MPRHRLTTPASRHLVEILDYTVEHFGSVIALELEARMRSTMELLADFPEMGHTRVELTPKPVLFFTVDPYLICYRIEDRTVVIVAILHGARDLERLLKHRSI